MDSSIGGVYSDRFAVLEVTHCCYYGNGSKNRTRFSLGRAWYCVWTHGRGESRRYAPWNAHVEQRGMCKDSTWSEVDGKALYYQQLPSSGLQWVTLSVVTSRRSSLTLSLLLPLLSSNWLISTIHLRLLNYFCSSVVFISLLPFSPSFQPPTSFFLHKVSLCGPGWPASSASVPFSCFVLST